MRNPKRIVAQCACILTISAMPMSCSGLRSTIEENPRTALGAGVGTLGGAVIGGTVFHSAGAAVAGGLIGGLAGGLVGHALESKDEDYDATVRDYSDLRGEGTVVRLENVDTDPSIIGPRQKVHLVTRYALLPEDPNQTRYALLPEDPNQRVRVTERWEITHNGQLVGNPTITETRSGGTWSSAIPLDLPPNAERGTYRARVIIEAAGAEDQGTTTFRVS